VAIEGTLPGVGLTPDIKTVAETGAPPKVLDGHARLSDLLERAKHAESYYDGHQRRFRRFAWRWRLGIGVLSATGTILLGVTVSAGVAPVLKNLALVTSALVTFLAMLESYRDDRSNYVRMAATFKALRRLRFEIEDQLAAAPTKHEIDRLAADFLAIQRAHDEAWVESRQRQSSRTTEPPPPPLPDKPDQ